MCGAVGADRIEPVLDEVDDTRLDSVADGADFLDRLAPRIKDVPVLDRRGDIRALCAAGERDRPVGVELHLQGQLLRLAAREVDPHLPHRVDDGRPDLLRGLLTRGLSADVRRAVALEQGLCHLRAASVVRADKDDVLHELALKRIP